MLFITCINIKKTFFQELVRTNNEGEMVKERRKICSSSSAFYMEILSLRPHVASVPSIHFFVLAPVYAQTCSNNSHVFICVLGENFISDQLSVSSAPPILSATRQSVYRLLVSFTSFFWYVRFILWLPISYLITTCTSCPPFCL